MKIRWKIILNRLQGVRELPRLLRCEFAKLKRKPLFFAAAAVSALIPLGCALFLPEMREFASGAEAVDRLMSTLFQMSAYLLLIPALVVLASNLLFEEQDNDTLKNLMTVPVSKPALALTKMGLLFLFAIAFMAVGGLVNLGIVLASGWEPVGFWKLFWVGNRSGNHDVGRRIALCASGGAFEPKLHYFGDHHIFLYGGQLYLWHKRFFYHAALRNQSGDAVARTADISLVLSVSGLVGFRRTDGRTAGTDQSLLCDNAPGISGRCSGGGGVSQFDRAGL